MAKRGNGEGTVWKQKSGSWRGQVMDGYTDEGKKNIISFTGETKGEVLDKIREFHNQVDAHVHINKHMCIGSWGDFWYANYKSQVQPSTHYLYKYTLRIIKDRLGDMALCDTLPMHIDQFLDSLVTKGYSLSQIKKCRTMLIQIFDEADRNGLVPFNPARKSKIIRDLDGTLFKPRHVKDAFSEAEVDILDKDLPNDLMGHSIRMMLHTGLRVQEVLALSPNDISSDGCDVSVRHAIKTVENKPVVGPPKSKRSNRTIPVPKKAIESALYLRNHCIGQLIWQISEEKPCCGVHSFRNRYYTALAQIEGVRKLSPHCCRHTYVTRLQEKGVPIDLIAKLAGHADIETTEIYTHTSFETLKRAIAQLDA